MANDRTNESIRIIKKYMNGNYYAFGENADVFELFNINISDDNEIIKEQVRHIKTLFHPDLISSIPEKYQYVYMYITDNLVTPLEEKSTKPYSIYLADKKQSIKDAAKEVEKKFITQEQKHKFYYDAMQKLDSEINKYNMDKEHERVIESISPLLEKLNKLINNYIELPVDKKRNIYEVFNIKKEMPVVEILTDSNYLEIKQLLKIDLDNYHEVYGNIVEENTALNDLKFLYKKCNDEYLVNQESKNRYDLELEEKKEKKIDVDLIQSTLMKCTTRYINSNKQDVTYYDIFNLEQNKTNDLIKATRQYNDLVITFKEENEKYIPEYYKEPFKDLLEKFTEFNKILNDENARAKYDRFFNGEKTIVKETQKQEEDYTSLIKTLITKYQKYYEDASFVNYYELFELPMNVNSDMIKKTNEFILLKKALVNDNIELDNVKDRLSFNDICSMFKNFEEVILSDNEKKSSYDERVKVRLSNTTLNFEYKETRAKESSKYEKIREDYYKTFEYLLLEYGATKTINLIANCLNNDNFEEFKDLNILLTDYTPNQIIKFLKSDFGNKKVTIELVEESFNQFMTKKIDILKIGVTRTYVKYDIEQVKKAITTYLESGDPVFFTSGDKNTIGRGKIAREIPQDMIKIILGCLKHDELGFLIDDIDNKYDLLKNIGSIDTLVSELLKAYLNEKKR